MLVYAPILLLEVNANLDLTFDSFDDLKEHPMARTFMLSYKQLMEGMLGNPIDVVKEGLDLSSIPDEKKEHFFNQPLK